LPQTGLPNLIEVALAEPPSARSPTVHFRQPGHVAHILYLDGHVEPHMDGTRNPPAATDPLVIVQMRDQYRIYDLGATDELWDRE
jgi:prepilin-type processing-associated H-X9-DG protein